MAAIGEVDEANSAIGVALTLVDDKTHARRLRAIQNEMFDLGADIATPGDVEGALRVTAGQVERLEQEIDAMNADLEPLTSFILPGGSPVAASLYLARTVVRRAERAAVALHAAEPINPQALAYLNRLSDHLFVLARHVARSCCIFRDDGLCCGRRRSWHLACTADDISIRHIQDGDRKV